MMIKCDFSWTARLLPRHRMCLCVSVCPGDVEAPCGKRGVCSDGLRGTGQCSCDKGFRGSACEVCDLGFFGPNCTGTAELHVQPGLCFCSILPSGRNQPGISHMILSGQLSQQSPHKIWRYLAPWHHILVFLESFQLPVHLGLFAGWYTDSAKLHN